MAQGRSLHIGLNYVDPNAYDGWDGELAGCINDANDLQRIASGLGYEHRKLLDAQATYAAVVREIGEAARALASGDIFLLTYSGHGSQVTDHDGDEADARDETWVLWDKMLIDDELRALWAQFQPGVRIFMLSDSCHSGTMSRAASYRRTFRGRARPHDGDQAEVVGDGVRFRMLDPAVREHVDERDAEQIMTRQWLTRGARTGNVGAHVLLISGCQDNQLSADGAKNGLFTQTLLEVWNDGAFQGGYYEFWKKISERMPWSQSPNYHPTGTPSAEFEKQRPFTIGASSSCPNGGGQAASHSRPTLRRGDSGEHVRHLQQRLVAHGHALTVDGRFGFATESAVHSFQSDNGLGVDGVVGRQTWAALERPPGGHQPAPGGMNDGQVDQPGQPVDGPTDDEPYEDPYDWSPDDGGTTNGTRPILGRGDTGEAVRELQGFLLDYGYNLTIDGIFGGQTESLVRSFQSSQGLTVDGIVGPDTWAALEGAWRTAPA